MLGDELVALASATFSLAEPGNSTDPPEPSQQLCTKAEKLPKCENLCPSGAGLLGGGRAQIQQSKGWGSSYCLQLSYPHLSPSFLSPNTGCVLQPAYCSVPQKWAHLSHTLSLAGRAPCEPCWRVMLSQHYLHFNPVTLESCKHLHFLSFIGYFSACPAEIPQPALSTEPRGRRSPAAGEGAGVGKAAGAARFTSQSWDKNIFRKTLLQEQEEKKILRQYYIFTDLYGFWSQVPRLAEHRGGIIFFLLKEWRDPTLILSFITTQKTSQLPQGWRYRLSQHRKSKWMYLLGWLSLLSMCVLFAGPYSYYFNLWVVFSSLSSSPSTRACLQVLLTPVKISIMKYHRQLDSSARTSGWHRTVPTGALPAPTLPRSRDPDKGSWRAHHAQEWSLPRLNRSHYN